MSSFSRPVSRWKFLLAMVTAFVIALTSLPLANIAAPATASGGGYRFRKAERCLMRRINAIRGRHGLRKLESDQQLAFGARQHAEEMSGNGGLYHDYDVNWKVTRWRRLSQNTGRGRSCRSLASAFMRSSEHRSHILGQYRFMGFGTQKRDGKVYVQQLFESRRDPGNVYHYP
jgi:uncharacterized protein YkwD